MIKSVRDVPFCTIKKILYIQDSKYTYEIDENGYGFAIIGSEKVLFFVNRYGEIDPGSICYADESFSRSIKP